MQMSVGLLDHYNVSTRKLKETDQFYENVLGFGRWGRLHCRRVWRQFQC
jgi:catechol-2,3-dioxygenase